MIEIVNMDHMVILLQDLDFITVTMNVTDSTIEGGSSIMVSPC